jgi:hypothetical protein
MPTTSRKSAMSTASSRKRQQSGRHRPTVVHKR